ncbi:MAG: membrane protein insertion efficiency factor YidD [Planctomycetia bacterium]|jgi:putative membrane protein insertion efficiency factor
MNRGIAMLRRLGRACDRGAAVVLIGAVAVYKVCLSPLLGRHCRFEPTCSVYFRQAVEKYGAVRGSLRGLARICRCHPWHPGGHDLP